MLSQECIKYIRNYMFVSPQFTLERSCRQGCPLSALLFTVAIEPLAEAIRTHPQVKGINSGSKDHVISLYADDILLFLKEPKTTIPVVLEIIQEFSKFSGYKINVSKSIALPLGTRDQNNGITYPPILFCPLTV